MNNAMQTQVEKPIVEKKPPHRPNKWGKPLEQSYIGFYIPEGYKNHFSVFKDLSRIDNSEDFKEYCSQIELVKDIKKLGKNKLSIYIRYVLAKHCRNNIHLLSKEN